MLTPIDRGRAAPIDVVVEWDTSNWSRALDLWSSHTSLDVSKCTALEIGGRNGGLSLWLALQGAQVVCSDLGGPTDLARRRHEEYGVASRITYAAVDVLNVPYDGTFDLVVFKSVLGSVAGEEGTVRQLQAVREMYKALKPGGELWFAENLVASPLHRALRARYVDWGRRWRYVAVAEMQEFLAPFTSTTARTFGFLGVFGRSERQRRALGRIDRLGADRLVPPSWRYIIAGVARR